MSTSTQFAICPPEPLRTPRQLLQAIAEYRDRWIGKQWSPATEQMMNSEEDSIRSRALPEAYLALDEHQLDFGIEFKPNPDGPAGSLICNLK